MPTKYYQKVVFFGSIYKYTKVIKLKKTIDSILKQKFIKPSIYLYCDGPVNTKLKILLIKYKKNLRFFETNKNCGLGKALNFLVKKIKPLDFDYYARFDDDDYFHSMKTCLQIDYMKKNKINICGSWSIENYKEDKNFYKNLPIEDKILKKRILMRSPFVHSSVIFDKMVFNKFNYDQTYKKIQDYKLWLDITKTNAKIKFGNIPAYLTYQNISNDFYFKRGRLIAFNELKLRTKFLYTNFNIIDLLFILLLYFFRISPVPLKKFFYAKFR